MKKHLLGFLLIFPMVLGCTSQYQYQMEQSLLLQENRRLENALYVTHAQLVDLKRENDALRGTKSSGNNITLPEQPLTRPKRNQSLPVENDEEAPPFAPPEIIIPKNTPGSETIPDSLKSSKLVLPEVLPKTVLDADEKSPPVWSASR
ncbi:MAG: hypothetical protein LBC02_01630 [Planctomycetaceae bacterium]|jgi:hypothetical protein|nr:hypothetical protein [Planctomycetaceae bacterium]